MGYKKKTDSKKFNFYIYDGDDLLADLPDASYHETAEWIIKDIMAFSGYTFRRKNKIAFIDAIVDDLGVQNKAIEVQIEEVSNWILNCYEIQKDRKGMKASNRDLRSLHFILQKKMMFFKGLHGLKPLGTYFKTGKYAFA